MIGTLDITVITLGMTGFPVDLPPFTYVSGNEAFGLYVGSDLKMNNTH